MVSLITCIISIQLLRLGLVNHTTDGQTFLKDSMDTLVMVALSTTAVACAFSVLSAIVSGLIAWQLKKEQKIRGRRRVLTKEEMIAERQKQLKQVCRLNDRSLTSWLNTRNNWTPINSFCGILKCLAYTVCGSIALSFQAKNISELIKIVCA